MKKNLTDNLIGALTKLISEYRADEIFSALVSVTEREQNLNDNEMKYLKAEVETFVLIYCGANIIKPQTLAQQRAIEESLCAIMPLYSDQSNNLLFKL